MKRIINLGGGIYNAHIEGNYIQGKEPKVKEPKKVEQFTKPNPDTINTNGANYVENLGGKVIDGDVINN
ncbi:MAG: hypothetical protein HWQ36_26015 [Nostoc sp. NMS2]|uniref:hypothetical protein n=1 Tax=Nostoc sp. NMS2 TaxID=2815389 RepID=UPI0025EC14AD|nr:hypothetical protein [Nostoc sp. NMS2]MBN3993843.1 hypothetical protein [Nostoc sp. NMS2]